MSTIVRIVRTVDISKARYAYDLKLKQNVELIDTVESDSGFTFWIVESDNGVYLTREDYLSDLHYFA